MEVDCHEVETFSHIPNLNESFQQFQEK